MTADRAQLIAGLRHLADTLENHPVLPLPYQGGAVDLDFWFLGGPDDTHDEWLTTQYQWRAAEKILPCNFTQAQTRDNTELAGRLGGPQGLKIALTARTHGPARFCGQCGTAAPGHTACCVARPGAEPGAAIMAGDLLAEAEGTAT